MLGVLFSAIAYRLLRREPVSDSRADPFFQLDLHATVPTDKTNTSITVHPSECFSETYQEARERFRMAAKAAGAELHTIPIVTTGSEEYTTDIAIIRGGLSGLVVHSSGVHGVEGYAGSAIQIAWLRHVATTTTTTKITTTTRSFPTIVLVHAINPYGMAHYHRTNENNVDLNRNALFPHQWQEEALQRDPNLAHYQDFVDFFNPYNSDTNRGHGFVLDAIPKLWRHGFTKLKTAMVTGQYHDPRGIFFGGQELEASWRKLSDFLNDVVLAEWKDEAENQGNDEKKKNDEEATRADESIDPNDKLSTAAKRTSGTPIVTWVDVHTGLGRYGDDTILCGKSQTWWTPQKLATAFPGSTVPGVDADGDNVNNGYQHIIGDGISFLRSMLVSETDSKDNENVLLVVQEFGTVSGFMAARSLVMENTIRQHTPERTGYGQELMKQAFYIQKPSWRKKILSRGIKVLDQAIVRSSGML